MNNAGVKYVMFNTFEWEIGVAIALKNLMSD